MDITLLKTFIAIVDEGNISLAAARLFVSQSTVSYRLKQLETELGMQLLYRNRGYQEIQLTTYGKSFINIARGHLALMEETEQIKMQNSGNILNISGVYGLNAHCFAPLYRDIIESNPDINLTIYCASGNEIFEQVRTNFVDIGFVYVVAKATNVTVKPLFSEEMCLICPEDAPYGDVVKPSELNVRDEIHLCWNPEIEAWHKRKFDPRTQPLATLFPGSYVFDCFIKKENWAVVAASTAKSMIDSFKTPLRMCRIKDGPASIKCYELLPEQFQYHAQAVSVFEEKLAAYIEELKESGFYH